MRRLAAAVASNSAVRAHTFTRTPAPSQLEETMNNSEALECANPKTVGSAIRTGTIEVNLDNGVVIVDDQPVQLTRKEYEILELLSLRKGTILTKEMFLNHLYGGMEEPELKIIDVFVCKLRKKLSQATGGYHHIETVWGRGYVLRDPAITSGKLQPVSTGKMPGRRCRIEVIPVSRLAPRQRTCRIELQGPVSDPVSTASAEIAGSGHRQSSGAAVPRARRFLGRLDRAS
jgi:DNA-binding winged helix-turn-helix (wHTH) protein